MTAIYEAFVKQVNLMNTAQAQTAWVSFVTRIDAALKDDAGIMGWRDYSSNISSFPALYHKNPVDTLFRLQDNLAIPDVEITLVRQENECKITVCASGKQKECLLNTTFKYKSMDDSLKVLEQIGIMLGRLAHTYGWEVK